MPIRVMIAVDESLAREGLKQVLNAEPDIEVSGEAGAGAAAIESVLSACPDVLVLDIDSPGRTGEEVARALKGEKPELGIVAIAASEDWVSIKGMLEAGADSYILKSGEIGEAVFAIREVARGRNYFDREVLKRIVLNYSGRMPEKDGLSDKEKGIVRMIADGKSTKEVAQALGLSVKSIEVYRSHIMRKLKVDNVAAIVKYAIREGLAKL